MLEIREQLQQILEWVYVVWYVDPKTNQWLKFDPKAPDYANTLKSLEYGQTYTMNVAMPRELWVEELQYKFDTGWNTFVWGNPELKPPVPQMTPKLAAWKVLLPLGAVAGLIALIQKRR